MQVPGYPRSPADLLPRIKPLCPLKRRPRGPQSLSGRFVDGKSPLTQLGMEALIVQSVASPLPTTLPRLLYTKRRKTTNNPSYMDQNLNLVRQEQQAEVLTTQ